MTQETPIEHSDVVGGSTASRVINCPGSVARNRKAPKSKGSSYAREGTALHEMIAQVLDHNKDPEKMLPFTHKQPPKGIEPAWELTVDENLWGELGQPALDMFDEYLNWLEDDQDGEPAVYMIEERGEFPGIPGAFGTSDVVYRCGKIAGIWDWKFGRSRVSAEENKQLLFYVAAMYVKYPGFFKGTDRVILCISQPKVNDVEPETWECGWEDVLAFIDELQAAVKEAEKPDAHIEKGPWCQFADCKAVCELHMGAAVALGEAMDKIKSKKAEPDLADFLSDALELAELAEAWAKHIFSIAHEKVDDGTSIPGWKTVAKRSAGREWTLDEGEVIDTLTGYDGVEVDDVAPRKVLSVAQAEKLLKKHGHSLDESDYRAKPSSGTTLVREGDPRPEKGTPTATAKALGKALSQKTGN